MNRYIPTIFVKRDKDKAPKLIIAIYVDDGLVCSSSKDELQAVLDHLRRKFEITAVDPECFLGFGIKRDRLEKSLFISQTYYIKEVLERFGMSDAKLASTLADPSVRLCREGTTDNPQSEKVTAPHREIMGSLNYAMIGTRPDIAFAVGLLSRFNQEPRMPHYAAAKRILSYPKGTADVGLLLGKRQSIIALCRFVIR